MPMGHGEDPSNNEQTINRDIVTYEEIKQTSPGAWCSKGKSSKDEDDITHNKKIDLTKLINNNSTF